MPAGGRRGRTSGAGGPVQSAAETRRQLAAGACARGLVGAGGRMLQVSRTISESSVPDGRGEPRPPRAEGSFGELGVPAAAEARTIEPGEPLRVSLGAALIQADCS